MFGNLSGRAKEFERSGIRIRNFAQLSLFARLDPYQLAKKLGMRVIDVCSLYLSIENARTLLVLKANEWSGSSSGVLPDGAVLIILNKTQSEQRRRATLMEEICHVLLGHQRDRLVYSQARLDFDQRKETEAYGVGAAALVPHVSLKKMLLQGRTHEEIAQWFGVSRSLVEYRDQLTSSTYLI